MPDLFVHKKTTLQTLPPKPKKNASVSQQTANIVLADQKTGEEIIKLIRRHPLTNLPWFLAFSFLLLLPFTLFSFRNFFQNFPFSLPSNLLLFLLASYLLLLAGYFLINLTSWFYNVGIITSERIVDIDFSAGSFRNVASAPIRAIQDVHYTMQGFFQSLFNFGDLFVQTESRQPNLEFFSIPHPDQISDLLTKLQEAEPSVT